MALTGANGLFDETAHSAIEVGGVFAFALKTRMSENPIVIPR